MNIAKALCVAAALVTVSARAQTMSPAEVPQVFVIEKAGESTICRVASAAEARVAAKPAVATHLIYGGPKTIRPNANGLKINLLATAQLESFPAAKQAFIRAAQTWESLLTTPIEIYIDVDFGPTRFGQAWDSDKVIGSASGDDRCCGSVATVKQALLSRASGSLEQQLYSQIPTTLSTDLGVVNQVAGSSPLLRALGLIDPKPPQSESKPNIGFNSRFSFDLTPEDGIDPNKMDFEAVAIHEMGHVLGFSSRVGYRELDPTSELRMAIMDLFRLRPGNGSNFGGATRILSSGGEHIYWTGSAELPFSTGRPDGTGGDGNQASHWKDDALLGFNIGLMDPNLEDGVRKTLSNNDKIGFDRMGWTLSDTATAELLKFVAVAPCRVHDTRDTSGPRLTSGTTRTFQITNTRCSIPSTARAVSVNVTVTNNGTGYLSLWPSGRQQPVVSTINFQAGGQYALANAAIVPLGPDGAINIFPEGNTDVILDVNGYFVQQ